MPSHRLLRVALALLALAAASCAKLPTDPTAAPARESMRLDAERGADDDSKGRGPNQGLGAASEPVPPVTYSDSMVVTMAAGGAGGSWDCGKFRLIAPGAAMPQGGVFAMHVDGRARVIDITDPNGLNARFDTSVNLDYDLREVDGSEYERYTVLRFDPQLGYVPLDSEDVSIHGHHLRARVTQFGRYQVVNESKAGWRGEPREMQE